MNDSSSSSRPAASAARSAILVALFSIAGLAALSAQDSPPFSRGVNLTNWFQAPNIGLILPNKYTETDFRNIKSLGCDVVRLPVNLARIARATPDGRIPDRLFELLDQAVQWSSANGLCLILDNHTQENDARIASDFGQTLPKLWAQMAAHFRNAPSSVLYEIFNEPHDISGWDRIQRAALAAIRAQDPDRLVVVTGADWGGINGLVALKPIDDPKLIYSFHFYDPFIFTHQGADWANQEGLSGVSFPPDKSRVPAIGKTAHRTEIERNLQRYFSTDPIYAMRSQLDKAAAWARKNKVRIFDGEMGVYDEICPARRQGSLVRLHPWSS